ncbi:MAG: diguanylate cyclase [Glaciecola sp.]
MERDHTTAHKESKHAFFALPNVLYGVNFGVLGAFLNAFLHITVFADFTLFFGQIFVFICLATRGINAAFITVLFTSISAAILGNEPFLIIILMLEMFIVHVLMIRGFFMFQSATLYWLVVGIPLTFTLHALTSFTSTELLFVNGITRGINGLICLSIASVICWFLPSIFAYKKYYSQPPRLASLIFSLCMITVTLPAMVVASFFMWQTTTNNEQSVLKALSSQVEQIQKTNFVEINRHLTGIKMLSSILSTTHGVQLQPLLNATAKHYELFQSVIIADQQGRVVRAAPNQFAIKLQKLRNPNLRNRDYFIRAKTTHQPVVSDALVGKGFGNDYLLSLAAPIVQNGEFSGLVQGAILLDSLAQLNHSSDDSDYQFIITDSKGRIIARSDTLGFPLLSNFDYEPVSDPLIPHISVLSFNQKKYLYTQVSSEYGWQITVLGDTSEVTSVIFDFFFMLTVATFFMLAAFAFIANALAQKITKPLVDIAQHFPNSERHMEILDESHVSSEMVTLTNRLIDSHEVMTNFQQQLSEQVHHKTKQLKKLNKELYSIAQKDSLTQLLNRAGFNRLALTAYRNCTRNHNSLSVIFLDIDHFKRINDNFGHPFGDKCIVAAANTILQHCKRDTDIIGRYGGEEFIIMISGGEVAEHVERVELIRKQVEALKFNTDSSQVSMTVSAGMCSLDENFNIDYDDLLQLADEQLYLSKRGGRNRISSIIK